MRRQVFSSSFFFFLSFKSFFSFFLTLILFSSCSLSFFFFFSLPQVNGQCMPLDGRNVLSADQDYDLIDGDILVSRNSKQDFLFHPKSQDVKQNRPPGRFSAPPSTSNSSWSEILWPSKIIPLDFHSSAKNDIKNLIYQSMKYYMSNTCVIFRERLQSDKFWVTFRSDSSGCWSFLGRDESCVDQGQPVSLSGNCETLAIVLHELGHVVGLRHQHNRFDRDQHVRIIYENIAKVNHRYFKKEEFKSENFGIPFDVTSLMQYNQWHFSSDIFNKSSMVTNDPNLQILLGKSNGLSFWDRKLVNFYYSCNETCATYEENVCMNGGYLYPQLGGECQCQCPPNFAGKQCEIQTAASYYEAVAPQTCGGRFELNSKSGQNDNLLVIETPEFPRNRPSANISCVWMIEGQLGDQLVINFQVFNLTGRSWNNKCVNESLEIRFNENYLGSFFCGDDLKTGSVIVVPKITGKIPKVTLLLQSFDNLSTGNMRASVVALDLPVTSPANESVLITSTMASEEGVRPSAVTHEAESEWREKPINRLITFPFQILVSLIKSFNEGFQEGEET